MEDVPPTLRTDPRSLYTARLEACTHEVARRRRQHTLIGYVRLLWAALFVAFAWFTFARHTLAWEWLVFPWLGFVVTAFFHARILSAGARAQRGAAWCQHGLARIDDRWPGLRPRTTRPGTSPETSANLYASDLDLFGPASLFELLCSARTTLGEDTLASWLLEPAPLEDILARQAALADLRDRTTLREAIASTPGEDPLNLNRKNLSTWATSHEHALPTWATWLAPGLMLLTLASVGLCVHQHSLLPLAIMYAIDAAIVYTLQRRLNPILAEARENSASFHAISDLFAQLERETFSAPLLQHAHANLLKESQPASAAVRRLAQLARADVLRNGLFRILDIGLLYSVQLGLLVQSWRARHGAQLPLWLDTLGQCEALLSLSAYHFEHPEDTFPELATDTLTFAAQQLGHPLLPQATCVRNNVTLDPTTRLLLVSGSNMSGKSTLLRSVGVSAAMAMAGSPVRAKHLHLTPVHIAASIQINDSLQSGRSRFYAEILRLRAICDLAREHPPVLFLLDELLAGTNSRDRLAGATGLMRELLSLGAIGLLSTHDLALTTITGPESQPIRNVHFEDRITGDRLEFDYTLRNGVVTRSNGLDLMRLIGLQV